VLSPGAARVLPLSGAGAAATDAELVARGLAGERFALQLLYRRHVSPVAACVTRLLARSTEAEDVVQDAFLTAFRELDRLSEPARFAPWLLRIAVRQAHRRFRRRRLLARFGLDRGVDDAQLAMVVDPAAAPDVCAELGRIDRELAALPAELRMAWMLRHVEGYALEELAEQCNCSLATAKRRIQRAEASIGARLDAGDARASRDPGGEHG
jgi:RNA polymerase sigma-70 factor, ECF subfamily